MAPFDIKPLTEAFTLAGSAISILKQIKDMLPESPKRQEAEAKLERAERELKQAEAQTAKSLGYELCREHFPPEVMLSEDDRVWKCPKCGNVKKTGGVFFG
jgi:hypothetical protein